MTVNANRVIVGSNGSVHVAPVGTAEPADETAALNAAFKDLGYISEEGVLFNASPNVQDILAWQTEFPIRSLTESRQGGLAFTMREWSGTNFKTAFGGGTQTMPTAGHFKYVPPSGAQQIQCVVVTWTDQPAATLLTYRLVVPRAQVVEPVEIPLRRAQSAGLAVTFRVLGSTSGGDPWYLLTNDPFLAS
jgi:hypothetical protein